MSPLRSLTLALAAALALFVLTAGASAASAPLHAATVQKCGGVPKGAGLFNIRARGVTCKRARSFVRHAPQSCYSQDGCRFRGFKCRTRTTGFEESNTRCTRDSDVIRWDSGA